MSKERLIAVVALAAVVIARPTATYIPVPAQMIAFTKAGACPAGWSEYTTARGRYLIGLPSGGTNQGTDGTALSNLEDRPVGQHSHTISDPGHAHGITDPGHTHTLYADASGLTGGTSWLLSNGPNVNNTNGEASATTGITVNTGSTGITGTANSGSVALTNAPYVQLMACEKQ